MVLVFLWNQRTCPSRGHLASFPLRGVSVHRLELPGFMKGSIQVELELMILILIAADQPKHSPDPVRTQSGPRHEVISDTRVGSPISPIISPLCSILQGTPDPGLHRCSLTHKTTRTLFVPPAGQCNLSHHKNCLQIQVLLEGPTFNLWDPHTVLLVGLVSSWWAPMRGCLGQIYRVQSSPARSSVQLSVFGF